MKGVLKLENGKELTVEIDENTLKSIEEPKKTGYERIKLNERYFSVDTHNNIISCCEDCTLYDHEQYVVANYYSDKTVAENNARADTLMRKLRRFAVEHREQELEWKNCMQTKYSIYYDHEEGVFWVDEMRVTQDLGKIYFDSKEKAKTAVEEFKDELIWYFTEYKDSL